MRGKLLQRQRPTRFCLLSYSQLHTLKVRVTPAGFTKRRNKKTDIMNKIISALLLLCCVSLCNTANILAILTLASPSIRLWNTAFLTELASKGHNVTVLSTEKQKNTVANLTDLPIEGIYEYVGGSYNYDILSEASTFYWMQETFAFFEKGCEFTLRSKSFKQLLDYPPDFKFDVVLMEPIGVECLLGILPRFGDPPIIAVNSFSIPMWVFDITGTPANPAYVPHFYLPYDDNMNFQERVLNFLAYMYTKVYYNYVYMPFMEREAKALFGPQIPSVFETMHNVSVALSNFHPTLDSAFPAAPNLIPIGAIQVKDPKPLPADIKKFLDEAKEGAIYMSFGTNVRSDQLSLEKRKAILSAFAELPQKVLWKFESDLSDVPKNVLVRKWLPQNDILAHPNIKVFITHSGLHSTHETIIRGVPVIGVPFIIDQHPNIRKMVKLGCGILLEYKDLTKDSLQQTIREIIGNPSYRQNIKALSETFQDNPHKPLESAVYWTEYVIRHKGAPHLQTGAKNLNFFQYFLIDVIAFLLAIPTLLMVALYKICCRRESTHKRKQKKN